jgi:long-subunit fatty acid transport protein
MKTQAQNSPENKLGAWFMYNGSHKFNDKLALKTMAHFRYFETTSEFQQAIYRIGFNYKINKNFNFTLGVSTVDTDTQYKSPSEFLTEFRIYEDFNLNTNFTKLKLRHRFRFEHRFIELQGIKSTESWLRYDINATYPLSDIWSMYAFNEIFVNFKGDLFPQNWTGAGFLYKLNSNVKFKVGYFYQKFKNVGFDRLQLGIILNTDFREKAIN